MMVVNRMERRDTCKQPRERPPWGTPSDVRRHFAGKETLLEGIEDVRDEDDFFPWLVDPTNLKRLDTALHSFFALTTAEIDEATDLILSTIQRLEERLGSILLIVGVNRDAVTHDFVLYFTYKRAPISIARLLECEADIVKEVTRSILSLRDIENIRESWVSGFNISISKTGAVTIYPTINSKEYPMSVEELAAFKTILAKYCEVPPE
jgi:hypothetical protein